MLQIRISLMVSMVVLLLTACSSGDEGVEDPFRTFGRQVEEAITKGDAAFFSKHAMHTSETCGPTSQIEPCSGKQPGTRVDIFALKIPPGGSYVTLAEFQAYIETWLAESRRDLRDSFGDGTPRLYALATAGGVTHSIATSLVPDSSGAPTRVVHVFTWRLGPSSWVLINDIVLDDSGQPGLQARDWLSGTCDPCKEHWEKW